MEAKKKNYTDLAMRDFAIGEIIEDQIGEELSLADRNMLCVYGVYLLKYFGMNFEGEDLTPSPWIKTKQFDIPTVRERVESLDREISLEVIKVNKTVLLEQEKEPIEQLRQTIEDLKDINCYNCKKVYSIKQRLQALSTIIYMIKYNEGCLSSVRDKLRKTDLNSGEENLAVYRVYQKTNR